MCDETTESENEVFLANTRLSRRELGVGAGAAAVGVAAGCTPPPPASNGATPTSEPTGATSAAPSASASAPAKPTGAPTKSRSVTIKTPDGEAEAFFVAPETGKHPGVIMWPDVAGLREAYRTMATRLAGEGYAVLAVNCYYRSTKMPLFESFAEWRTDEGRARVQPMREALTHEAITKDGAAFAAWLDAQPEVDTAKKLATQGYCMSGSFTIRTAAAVPERFGAIASFHGGGLVTEEPTSPHQLLAKMKGAALICIAQNDDARQPEAKTELKKAAEAAKLPAEIEVYPAQHGWCTIDSPVYDEAQAERAWARLLATYREHL